MKEIYDLCLNAQYAELVLGSDWKTNPQYERLSDELVRVTGVVGDEVYTRARSAFQEFIQPREGTRWYGCRIERTYTKKEIDAAELFLVRSFYQYGAAKEYGTWYTDAPQSPDCGIGEWPKLRPLTCALGSRQVGPMHYPFGKLTKRDLISLWGGETVISERLAKLIDDGGFRGGKIEPIWNTARGAKALPALSDTPSGAELISRAESLGMKVSDRQFWSWLESKEQLPAFDRALWQEKTLAEQKRPTATAPHNYFQLTVESSPLAVAEPTVLADPFFGGLQHHCKCEFGEIHGRLCSCLYVERSSWNGADICRTDLFFGGRQGLFRPYRQLIVSKKLFDAMKANKVTKAQFEIVELV